MPEGASPFPDPQVKRPAASDAIRRALANGGKGIPLARPAMRLLRSADRVVILGPAGGALAAVLAGRRGIPNVVLIERDAAGREAFHRAYADHGLFRIRLADGLPDTGSATFLLASVVPEDPLPNLPPHFIPTRGALLHMPVPTEAGGNLVARLLDGGLLPSPDVPAPGIRAFHR